MPKTYPDVPNKPIDGDLSDNCRIGPELVEQLQRLEAVARHYGRRLDDETDLLLLVLEILRDNHPGFRVEYPNPFECNMIGAPTAFDVVDLATLMAELGCLVKDRKASYTKGYTLKNELGTMRLIAASSYFQKRAKEWKLYKGHSKNEIDQEKLVSKIHDVWRKDVRPILERPILTQNSKLNKTQFLFRHGVYPLLFGDREPEN